MDRILHIEMLAIAAGFIVGTYLATELCTIPMVFAAVVGIFACIAHRCATGRRAPVVATVGLFAGVLNVAATQVPGDELRRTLSAGPVDLLVAGRVSTGPRVADWGTTYTVSLADIDGRPTRASVRLVTDADAGELWPGTMIRVFVRCRGPAPSDFRDRTGQAEVFRARRLTASCRAREPATVIESPTTAAAWLAQRRRHVERRLRVLLGHRAGVPIAMLTGTRSWVAESERLAHQRAGTAHLLAISGLHFGALAGIAWFGFGWLARRSAWVCGRVGARRAAALLVVLAMAAYLALVGAPISAVRAFIAVTTLALAVVCHREPSPLVTLSIAAIAVLCWSPWQIRQLGFQLSFVATLAIVCFWHRRPAALAPDRLVLEASRLGATARRVGSFACMSWVATAATSPVVFAAFGEWSWAAFATNLFAVLVVTVLVFPALLLGVCTMDVLPAVGGPVLRLAAEIMFNVTLAVEAASDTPGAVSATGTPEPALALLSVVTLLTAVADRLRLRSLLVHTGAVVAMFASSPSFHPPAGWRLHFLPVGQGDATLIETPRGERILVDAGGSRFGRDPGRAVVVPYLRRAGIEYLDAVVITHGDTDHVGGVPAVLEQLDVGMVVREPIESPFAGLEFSQWTDEGSRNDRSIVVRIDTGAARVLLTGDVEARAEAVYVSAGRAEPITVLKVAHHGSQTSTTQAFLDAVEPSIAIVSAGRHNRFGHPHDEVLDRLDERGTTVFRTDQHGLIVMDFDNVGHVETRVTRP